MPEANSNEPFQFSLRSLILAPAAAVIVFVLLFNFATFFFKGTVHEHQFSQITEGMTKQQILAILGEPAVYEDSHEWRYYVNGTSMFIEFEGEPPIVEGTWAL